MKIPNRRETLVLALFFLVANVGNCVYAAFGMQPSGAFVLLYYIGAFWAVTAWLVADAKRLGVDLPFDVGLLLYLAWPVILPYHLFRTRGIRGCVTVAGLFALFLSTYLVGVLVYYIIAANRSV